MLLDNSGGTTTRFPPTPPPAAPSPPRRPTLSSCEFSDAVSCGQPPAPALRTLRTRREAGAVVVAVRAVVYSGAMRSTSIQYPRDRGCEESCRCEVQEIHGNVGRKFGRAGVHPPCIPGTLSRAPRERGIKLRRRGLNMACGNASPTSGEPHSALARPEESRIQRQNPSDQADEREDEPAPLDRLADSRMRFHLFILLILFPRLSP